MYNVVDFINKFSFIPTLLVAAYAAFVYNKLPHRIQVFTWFILLSGIIEASSRILWFNGKNNMPLLHLYVAGGFLCLSYFYRYLLKDFVNPKIIWIVQIAFTVFTLINSLFIQNVYTFNSYALTVESVILVIFSLTTYLLMMNDVVKKNHARIHKSVDWLNSGIFIYYASSLLIFHFGNMITILSPSALVDYTWVLHALFSVVMYCCFFVGLWNQVKD
jgi:hypothetical protein